MQDKKLKELEKYRKVLYVIDMVKGFVTEGAMHDSYIANTIPEQLKIIEKFQREQQGVAFIKDCHEKECAEFSEFPPHCIKNTSEAELVEELQVFEKDTSLIYPKNSTSAIFAPNVLPELNCMENLEEVVGVGCCTDICVTNFLIPLKNYFNQNNRKIPIFAVKKAIETYDAPNHNREYFNKIAYELMQQAGIILVEDLEELEEKEKKMILKKEGK